jgi:hypothetical protein
MFGGKLIYLFYCDEYDHCEGTTQYTRSSKHATIEAVYCVDHGTARC